MEGIYVTFEEIWRKSKWCLSHAFIQNFSMESSLLGLLLISALHTWVINNHNQPPFKGYCVLVMVTWIVSASLTSVPLLLTDHTESGLCIFHTFTEENFVFSIVLHLGINPAILLVSILLTLQSAFTIYKNDLRVRKFRTGSSQKIKSMLVLLSHVTCRCLCWAPLQTSLLVLLSGGNISSDIMMYLMLMGFSLNLLINPFLYTLRTLARHKKSN